MSSSDATAKRTLRDRPLGRALILAVVLGVALLATRSCATDGDVSADQAIEIAQGVQAFEPDDIQVRFFRQGVPKSVPLWAVSLYQGTPTSPTRVQVVVVDARTGDIVDDGL